MNKLNREDIKYFIFLSFVLFLSAIITFDFNSLKVEAKEQKSIIIEHKLNINKDESIINLNISTVNGLDIINLPNGKSLQYNNLYETTISYFVDTPGEYKFEIIDIMGNTSYYSVNIKEPKKEISKFNYQANNYNFNKKNKSIIII